MPLTALLFTLTALLLQVGIVCPLVCDAAQFPWQTRPPGRPFSTGPIIYPPGTIHYVRQPAKKAPVPFFQRAWYVGFLLMALAVIVLYMLLYLAVRLRFRVAEQEAAKRSLAGINSDQEENPFSDHSSGEDKESE
ncbi:uncharacterized protein Tco025E_00319 [Trypanosoma conorhini]|uniref:Uncharacterized protein n=1 Tax=Trypanosoma conorhini TaxID=83891 RepID=A0A422QBW9_9TRYP|nr:uncharacterized protein Tco025E_00319 [Trypanosoma conorhini]RNF27457.1 hypothetical protein Tco025E_00319 [Trypanosoma conorhini]